MLDSDWGYIKREGDSAGSGEGEGEREGALASC